MRQEAGGWAALAWAKSKAPDYWALRRWVDEDREEAVTPLNKASLKDCSPIRQSCLWPAAFTMCLAPWKRMPPVLKTVQKDAGEMAMQIYARIRVLIHDPT